MPRRFAPVLPAAFVIAGACVFSPLTPRALAQSQPASAPQSKAEYLANFADLKDELRSLAAAHSQSCSLMAIASSGQGREVFLLTLAADGKAADSKPALLIVAGLDARHRVGVETALRVAQHLLTDHADMLKDITMYLAPCVNPDGYERNLGQVNYGHIGNLRAVDDDRDGAADEDGPADLNGDGVITMMRRIDPPLDDRATHLPDPAEPRLLKRADAAKGERAVYSLYVEGLDADSDGQVAEDGPGGVDLDHNFMHRYPEHDRDAGAMPLSEPESLALADFVIAHKNIVAVITYGRHDNLINVPDGRGTDISSAPRDLDSGDVDLYKEMSRVFKEKTGQSRAASADTAGSFEAWIYAQRGLPSFATNVWGRPDTKDDQKPGGAGGAAAAAPRDAVSGEWSGSVNVQDVGDIPFTFSLSLAPDNSVTGTASAMGQTAKLSGTFDPPSASAKLTGDFGDGQTAAYDLKFKGAEMTGTHHAPTGESIEFTAKRAPPGAAAPSSGGAKPQAASGSDAAATAPAENAGAAQQAPPSGRRGGGGAGGRPGARGGTAGAAGGGSDDKKAEDAEAAAWLKYSDAQRGGEGFIAWKPFDHPTLGKVEIGGFVPGFQMNPPASELDELGAKETDFAIEVISRRPRLTLQGPDVKKLADGLYEIRLGIVNEGYLPTATAMARRARSIFPTVVRLSTPIDHIVTGDRVNKTYGIGGAGDRATYHWIIRADNGSDITIDIVNPHLGNQNIKFTAEAKP